MGVVTYGTLREMVYQNRSLILPRRHELEIIIVRVGEGRDHHFRLFRRIVGLRDDRGPDLLDSFEFPLYIPGLEIEHDPFGFRVLSLYFVVRAKRDESLAGKESVVTAFRPVGIFLKNLLVKIRELFGILGKYQ